MKIEPVKSSGNLINSFKATANNYITKISLIISQLYNKLIGKTNPPKERRDVPRVGEKIRKPPNAPYVDEFKAILKTASPRGKPTQSANLLRAIRREEFPPAGPPIVLQKQARSPAISNFKKNYIENLKTLYFLRARPQDLEKKLNEFTSLGYDIENYSEQIFSEENKKLLESLNAKARSLPPHERELLQNMVSDLLLTSSLINTKTTTKGKKTYRESIDVLTPHMLHKVLKNLHVSAGDVTAEMGIYSKLFQDFPRGPHGEKLDYKELSLPQRMFLLSFANLKPKFYTECLKSNAFKKIFERRDLDKWLLGSSGSLEQVYLNTCSGAATSQATLNHVASIAIMSILGEKLSQELLAKSNELEGGMKKKFIQAQATKLLGRFKGISEKIENLPERDLKQVRNQSIDSRMVKKFPTNRTG